MFFPLIFSSLCFSYHTLSLNPQTVANLFIFLPILVLQIMDLGHVMLMISQSEFIGIIIGIF